MLPIYSFLEQHISSYLQTVTEQTSGAIIFDEWTSRIGNHYVGIVYQWISADWKIQQALLSVPHLKRSLAVKLEAKIKDALQKFNLSSSVVAAVGDGGQNVNKAADFGFERVSCFCHLLQNCFAGSITTLEKFDLAQETLTKVVKKTTRVGDGLSLSISFGFFLFKLIIKCLRPTIRGK